MEISPFGKEDTGGFLALAAAEGWISAPWELDFLRETFPSGCLVCRDEGRGVAFVTSIKHDRSGWIGNLIVERALRGRGIGSTLLLRALEALLTAGVRTVWLTASESGRPIYERLGFSAIDTVHRWEGRGALASCRTAVRAEEISAQDASGWGDVRVSLLRTVAERGRCLTVPGGFLVTQPWEEGVQIGPWGCACATAAAELLGRSFAPDPDGGRFFLDVPEGNGTASALLRSDGFLPRSSAILMYRGETPAYAPERIYALASMGSMG